jgi:hypothetical protein
MRKSGLTDDSLVQAVTEMNQGLIDADLGSGLFKITYWHRSSWQERWC